MSTPVPRRRPAPSRSRPVFARAYQWASRVAEGHGMGRHRDRLLAGLTGRVLEVGAGNGLNLLHYPPTVELVLAVEPEPRLRAAARAEASRADIGVLLLAADAHRLPLADDSVDAAVSCLVLCSVAEPHRVLSELRRVLRPDGELVFLEHVIGRTLGLARLQRWLDATVWPRLAGGCHCARDTAGTITAAGFDIGTIERFRFPDTRLPLPTSPHIRGRAHPRRA